MGIGSSYAGTRPSWGGGGDGGGESGDRSDPGGDGHPPPSRSGRYRRAPYIALLLTVLVLGALSQTPPGLAALRAAGVVATPKPYSELAFASPQGLPRQLSPGTTVRFPFTVRNATGRLHLYRWTVTQAAGGSTRQAAAGETRLSDGLVATLRPAFRVKCTTGSVTVTVKLDTGESIAFTAECLPPDAGQQG